MRLSLREVTAKDMELLYKWANDPCGRMLFIQNPFHMRIIKCGLPKIWLTERY